MRRWSRAWVRGGLLTSLLLATPAERGLWSTSELDVAVVGCHEWQAGACMLRDELTKLTLWLDTDAESVPSTKIDGADVDAQAVAVAGGVQISVEVPATATELSLHLRTTEGDASMRMPLRRWPLPGEIRTFERIGATDPKAAIAHLEQALHDADGLTRLELIDRVRRIDNHPKRIDQAIEQVELARELDAPLAEMRALGNLAFVRTTRLGDPAGAAPFIERLLELGRDHPEAKARGHYYAAVVARQTGDLSAALRHLSQAEWVAEGLSLDPTLIDAYDWHGSTLADLGRGEEAVELAARGLEIALEGAKSCETRSRLLANYGWTHLVLAAAELPHDDPHLYFEEALTLLGECPNPSRHASRMVDLALTELTFDQPGRALEWLAELDAEPRGLRPWIEEARARAAEGVGYWALVPSLLQRPAAAAEPQLRWAALVRQAQSELRWGFVDVAAETFARAEAELDAELRGVAISSGAELYLAGKSASARGLVEALLEQGHTAEAMCRARLARRRSLARLDRVARIGAASPEMRRQWEEAVSQVRAARDAIEAEQARLWELRVDEQERRRAKLEARAQQTEALLDEAVRKLGVRATTEGCDALAGPGENELLVVLAELPRGWVVFASTEDGVIAERLTGAELLDPSSAWLAKIEAPLRAARRITVVPTGAAWGVPVHALPFEDGVLLDHAPVAYSLDLPPRTSSTVATTALVVADPTGNLPEALAESRDVASTLAAAGWSVDERTGAAASRAAVTDALTNVSLFHYAGHGRADGVVGWNSALTLHDAEDLSVDDILALPSVPTGVVLTGCETGAVSLETLAGGMNLGRAFVLAGAEWVVAADVRVEDALARDVGTRLYRTAETLDGPTALRQALVELRDREGWEAFRVVVP